MTAASGDVWFWVSVVLWNLGAITTYQALRYVGIQQGKPRPSRFAYLGVFVVWPLLPLVVGFGAIAGRIAGRRRARKG